MTCWGESLLSAIILSSFYWVILLYFLLTSPPTYGPLCLLPLSAKLWVIVTIFYSSPISSLTHPNHNPIEISLFKVPKGLHITKHNREISDLIWLDVWAMFDATGHSSLVHLLHFLSRTPLPPVSSFHPPDGALFFSLTDACSSPQLFLLGCPRAQPLAVSSIHTHTLVDLIWSHGFIGWWRPRALFPVICYDERLLDITSWMSI